MFATQYAIDHTDRGIHLRLVDRLYIDGADAIRAEDAELRSGLLLGPLQLGDRDEHDLLALQPA